MLFDTALKFDKLITAFVKSSFYQLRGLAKVKPSLLFSNFEKVIYAFISSRLDYCNALYTGISQFSFSHLQHVQNVAARLLTGACK